MDAKTTGFSLRCSQEMQDRLTRYAQENGFAGCSAAAQYLLLAYLCSSDHGVFTPDGNEKLTKQLSLSLSRDSLLQLESAADLLQMKTSAVLRAAIRWGIGA